MSLRFNETNVNACCRSCNRFDEGNLPAYALQLNKLHGEGIINKLLAAKNQTVKFNQPIVDELTKVYKGLVAELKKQKGL